MSEKVEELWHRLKDAAREYASHNRHLNEHAAEELVFEVAREVKMTERMPADVVKFYVSEVLAFVREFSQTRQSAP